LINKEKVVEKMSTENLLFKGSTGGWLNAAQLEEKYILIFFNSNNKQIFEMPTSGNAIMQKGINMISLAKKEQCLALTFQLQTSFKITSPEIYCIYPNLEIQYLYPPIKKTTINTNY
jgi:photosystem I subunit 2